MKYLVSKLALLSLLPMLVMFTVEAGAQNRERPSFADFDANNDGQLSLEELSGMGSRHGTPEKMFERLDANGDGYITEDEFKSRQHGGRRGT